MDNRDLDKMIQDKLRDFRETPDPEVWERVRASLDRKKKKGLPIPLWLRIGAAAAIVAAGLFLLLPREGSNPEVPAVSRSAVQPELPEGRTTQNPSDDMSLPARNEDGLAGDVSTEEKREPSGSPGLSEGLVSSSGKGKTGASKDPGKEELENHRLAVAESGNRAPNVPDEKADEIAAGGEAEGLASAQQKTGAPTDSQTAGLMGESPVRKEDKDTDTPPENPQKKSIFEVLENQEAVAESEGAGGKWSIGPSLAPVYFNSFGNGSPISPNFSNNSKSGTVNMSYGVQVSYRLSRKLSVRSGIHRVDYGYNTDDIGFTSSPTARPNSLIRTISYSENSKNLVVHSTTSGAQQPQPPITADVSAPTAAREGQMLQEFGYLEIPMEMQYNLLDRKLGIDLIGGLSSLFLVENSVSLLSGEAVTEIGEATNMNSLNFSTNLGLGFYYRLNPHFEINLQPMFKYQLNTFTETSGSFRPYSIGVYSGLNFRF